MTLALASLLLAAVAPLPLPPAVPAGSPATLELLAEGARPHKVHDARPRAPGWPLHLLRVNDVGFVQRASDVAVSGEWVLVAANTGLWLHDAALVPRARLYPAAVEQVATSPDGSAVAFVPASTGRRELWVLGFPGLEVRAHVALEGAARIRFSPEGDRVVVAGGGTDHAYLLNLVGEPKLLALEVGEKVNDAVLLPGGAQLAVAHNGDSLDLIEVATGQRRFKSEPLVREHWRKVEAHTRSWSELFTPRPSRDQRTVGWDARHGALVGGGDDNVVWRFDAPLGPKLAAPRAQELGGNVVDLLVLADGSVVAADDEPELAALTPDHHLRARLAAEGRRPGATSYADVRLAGGGKEVLAAIDGQLVRWTPGKEVLLAEPYLPGREVRAFPQPADTLYLVTAGADQQTAVQRLAAGPAALDVPAEVVGTFPAHVEVLPLAQGDRLLWTRGTVIELPLGKKLQRPLALPGSVTDAQVAPDGQSAAFLGRHGELTVFHRGATRLEHAGKLPGKGHALSWDPAGPSWTRVDR